MRWFRMHADAIDDEKLGLLAFQDRWHFVALLCCKASGLLDADDSPQMMRRKVAYKVGLSVPELDELARRLDEVGLVDQETLQPRNWGKRQYASDTSAERVKRHREKRAAAGLVRQQAIDPRTREIVYARDGHKCIYCGATENLTIDHLTPQMRGGTEDEENLATACRACNASKRDRTYEEFVEYRKTSVTASETLLKRPQNTDSDSETETEKKKHRPRVARPDSVSKQAWSDWLAVRKAKRAGPVTQTVIKRMQTEAGLAGISLQAAVEEAAARGWQAFKAEWVSGGRPSKVTEAEDFVAKLTGRARHANADGRAIRPPAGLLRDSGDAVDVEWTEPGRGEGGVG